MLVNNAGKSIRRSINRSYDRFHDYQRTMQLNYFAPVKLMLGLLPEMRERDTGHIVNVSSIGLQMNTPRFAAYLASKAALDAFSRSIGPEVIGDGVHITTVYMPLVRTPMIAPTKIYDRFPTLSPEEAAEMLTEAIRKRPKKVATALGNLGQLTYAIAPGAQDLLVNRAYQLFPESGEPTEQADRGRAAGVRAGHARRALVTVSRRQRSAAGPHQLGEPRRADVPARHDHADPRARQRHRPAEQRRQGTGAAGLGDQLAALEQRPHRVDDLLVGHGHNLIDEPLDHRPGELARGRRSAGRRRSSA